MKSTILRSVTCGLLSVACALTLAACGGGGGGGGDSIGGTNSATIAFTGSSSSADVLASSGYVGRDVVPEADVDRLILTITRIDMRLKSDDDDGDDDSDDDDSETETDLRDDVPEAEIEGNVVIVYEDPVGIEVDIKQLQDVSEILSTANVPAGEYNRITIYYENPRLYLTADPETEITDIQITANGRMFINTNFELPDGEATLIILDFGGIQLTFNPGAGSYVLTPQLRVVIDVQEAEVEFEGVITTITPESMMLEVDNGQSTRDVVVTDDTEIYREIAVTDVVLNPADVPVSSSSIPAGSNAARSATEAITFDDLMVGDFVEIEGEAQVDGTIIADEIEVELEEIENIVVGTISSIDVPGNSFVVSTSTGDVTVVLGPSSEIKISTDVDIQLSLDDLVVGLLVEVDGSLLDGGNIFGDEVEVDAEEQVVGTIAAVGSNTISVDTGSATVEVVVDPGTEIRDDDTDTLVFGDLAIGQSVDVRGVTLSGSRFVARRVEIDGVV